MFVIKISVEKDLLEYSAISTTRRWHGRLSQHSSFGRTAL